MDAPVPLPPTEIRQGGGRMRFDDDYFVESGLAAVELLESAGLESGMRLLDFGSGPGRVAIGLIAAGWSGEYLGVEVNGRHVRWAEAEISPRFPRFRFVQVDAPNARYNPRGADTRRLPVESGSIDFICAFSVFTHMLGDDVAAYLGEMRRVLSPGGRACVTVFMEDDVPPESENPPWYGEWSRPLHCVLYSTDRLTDLARRATLSVDSIDEYHNRQKLLRLRPF
jgi:SAM-dependent methyltransferase